MMKIFFFEMVHIKFFSFFSSLSFIKGGQVLVTVLLLSMITSHHQKILR